MACTIESVSCNEKQQLDLLSLPKLTSAAAPRVCDLNQQTYGYRLDGQNYMPRRFEPFETILVGR